MNNNDKLERVWEHISKTNEELGDVQQDVREIKTDLAWVKKFQWLILTTSLTGLIAVLVSLINSVL